MTKVFNPYDTDPASQIIAQYQTLEAIRDSYIYKLESIRNYIKIGIHPTLIEIAKRELAIYRDAILLKGFTPLDVL